MYGEQHDDMHLQFDISANALEIRAVQSPNCVARCAVDCTCSCQEGKNN
jgi:hypothetical protein